MKIFVVALIDEESELIEGLVRAFRKKQDAETFVKTEPADYGIVEIELDN